MVARCRVQGQGCNFTCGTVVPGRVSHQAMGKDQSHLPLILPTNGRQRKCKSSVLCYEGYAYLKNAKRFPQQIALRQKSKFFFAFTRD